MGTDVAFADAARELGYAFADQGVTLVFGGSHRGLMGILADACLDAGGDVIGVIPQSLVDLEVAHTGLRDQRIVGSMHERKALMAELADAFLVMPGGLGTFDEMFEIMTWAQLGFHDKPMGLLDVNGFFDPLIALIDHLADTGFIRDRGTLHRDADAGTLLSLLTT